MSYENITTAQKERIHYITVNRPKQLNALNKATIQVLHNALKAANDDKETNVVMLTGSGDKAFVAGADIKEFADLGTEDGKALAAEGQKNLFACTENLCKPYSA